MFVLLGGIGCLTAAICFYAGYRVALMEPLASQSNQLWSERLEKVYQLNSLAAAIDGAVEEVFKTHDVMGESTEFQVALARFNERLSLLRHEMDQHLSAGEKETLAPSIAAAERAINGVTEEAKGIFESFEKKDAAAAGQRLPSLSGQYIQLVKGLADLYSGAAGLQQQGFIARQASVRVWRRVEYGCVALLLFTAGTILTLGLRRSNEVAADSEEKVRELNAELLHESRFRSLSTAMPIGVFSADAGGRFVFKNRRFHEIISIPAEASGVEDWAVLVHPLDADAFKAAWAKLFKDGQDLNGEFRLAAPSAKGPKWISLHACLWQESADKPVGCAGVMEDITARREADAARQTKLGEWEELYNQSPCGHHTTNAKGIITRINDTELKWLGWKREDLVGTVRFPELLTPASRQLFEEHVTAVSAPGAMAGLELELIRKNGSVTLALLTATVVRDVNGSHMATHCVLYDISKRKELETQLTKARDTAVQSDRYKSEFLATMSHEIRTPMNSVSGMTGLLLATSLTPEQLDYVQAIRTSADSLLTVINDILDFSKIEAGKLAIEIVDFDLNEVVETTLELLAEPASAKQLELAGFAAADAPVALRGDADRLRQVLTNLVGNAIKFTNSGEVVVQVSREMESDSHVRLRFQVTDTGIGVPPEEQARLFQPFRQLNNPITRKHGGTGLGLAICRQLVTLMEGEIGVQSVPGRGSTFWFTVRLEKQRRTSTAPPDRSRFRDRRVLVVDDHEASRRAIRHQLHPLALQLETALNGQEAWEKLRAAATDGKPCELAVIDQLMPELDGISLAARIKTDPALSKTKIILLGVMGSPPPPAKLQEAGIEACLLKPLKQARLIETVTAVLEGTSHAANPSAARLVPLLEESPNPKPISHKLRILLVEDHLINQRVALGLLAKIGFTANAAGNGVEALEALKQAPYDVILMDCQMPEMDGLEATRRIREMEANRAAGKQVNLAGERPLYIIALTANAMQGDRERCLEAGMNDYLSKPVRVDHLAAALQKAPAVDAAATVPVEAVPPAIIPPVAMEIEAAPPPAEEPKVVNNVEDAPVDLERMHELTEGSLDAVKELVDLYLAQSMELGDKLASIVQSGTPREMAQVAHKFCGASLTCGMMAVVPALRELERLGNEGKRDGAIDLEREVKRQSDRIRQFWTDYFGARLS